MDEEALKTMARQLRKPHGDGAKQVGEVMNTGNKLIYQTTIEILNLRDSENVLEIGMGNGNFVKDVVQTKEGITYLGCDYSEAMIEEARARNEDLIKGGNVQFQFNDILNLKYDPGTFDKIFTINTIYFWENPQQVLSILWNALKPEGKLVISLRPKSVMENIPFIKYGFRIFTKKEIIQLLSQNNFIAISAFERKEPDQEIDGKKIPLESLTISAIKP